MLTRFLTALVLLDAATCAASAQCPTIITQQHAVVNEVVAIQAVQVIYVPTYFASYVPPPPMPPADSQPAQSNGDMKALLEAIAANSAKADKTNELLQKLLGLLADPNAPAGPNAKAPVPATAPPVDKTASLVARAFGNSCVNCHAAKVADTKGGGFTIVGADDKSRSDFTPAEIRRIIARTQSGQMPPGGAKLPKEEIDAIREFYTRKQ